MATSNQGTTPIGMAGLRRMTAGWTAAVLMFLYLPMVLLVVYSFNKSPLNVVWTGATTAWYRQLWSNQPLKDAMQISLVLACIVTVMSVPLGTIGAWLLHRYRVPMGRVVMPLIYLPILMPDVIMGISFLVLFSVVFRPLNNWCMNHGGTQPFKLGWMTLILSHVTFCFPFVMVAITARLKGLDPSLEEAAMDLGATPAKAFLLVVLPHLLPAIISGALMSFTLSMDELIVSTFTHGPETETLPIRIFGFARVGFNPMLNAISAVFILATAIVMGVAEYLRSPYRAGRVSG